MVATEQSGFVDFKDKAEFSLFLVRALLAQARWRKLRAQRIGTTFVSGNKPELILSLTRFLRHSSISRVYNQLERTIRYSPEAFSKNVRAFRTIGILENPQKPRFGSTRFKTNAYIIKTLLGEYQIRSSRPTLKRLRNVIIPTAFFLDLARFMTVFGSDPLLSFIRSADRSLTELDRITGADLHLDEPQTRILESTWGLEAFKIASSWVEPIWKTTFSTRFPLRK